VTSNRDWFDAEAFEQKRAASGLRWGRPVRVHEVVASTNDLALSAVAGPDKTGIVFVARQQLAGRGRRGNAWRSNAGENLTLSILLRIPGPDELASGFSLLVGLAVRDVVARLLPSTVRAAVKWPNDVLLDGKKCAGILVESRRAPDGQLGVVLGLGLNVHTTAFPDSLPDATSLRSSGARLEALEFEDLMLDLLAALEERTARYLSAGLTPSLEELREHDFLSGKHVRIGEIEGVADGIDERGRLLVRNSRGLVEAAVTGHVELLTM